MNDRTLLVIAREQHGLVRRPDVERAGLTSWQWCQRLGRDEWVEAAPGVWYHAAVEPTWEMRLRAGLLSLGPQAALFAPSASAWWDLDGSAPGDVEFVVPRAGRWAAGRLDVHTTTAWDRGDQLIHNGLRCTNVTRTIIDLAAVGSAPRTIEAAIDSGVRARLTSMPTLRRRVGQLASRGRPGLALLRELLLDTGGESQLERRFLRLMRSHAIPRPECQVVHHNGRHTVARVDFQFTATNVVVEVGGRVGHASDADRQKDARRRNALLASGLDVVEFTTADVIEDPSYVVDTVRTALARSRSRSSADPQAVRY